MHEYQIIVWRDGERKLWYKAQQRRHYFFVFPFIGRWNDILPAWHTNIEDCEEQIRKQYIDNL